MTDEQIKNQLNSEYDKFLYGKYSGKIPIPKGFVDMFKKAILALPSFAHKISFLKVKAIATTSEENLTNSDVNDIIKVILNVPLIKLYEGADTDEKTFLSVVEKCAKMDAFILSYNTYIDEFSKTLSMKSERLRTLSSGIMDNKNGMKIIKGQA